MEPGIKGVSEIRRMPRLGKIRLGIKVEEPQKKPYPRATDYFVVPEIIKQYIGAKPTKLNIMFPVEDHCEFAIQWLRCYSFTQGLICKGNGMMCRRKVDTTTGDFASHTTQEWVWQDDLPCAPNICPMYYSETPQCRRVMNLLFLMPDVPGFGVWQLDTTSFYSIVNINSSLDLIQQLCGRISFIPLTLSLEPQLVEPPGIKRKTVHILQIRSDVKLAEIQRLGRRKPEQVLLPPLDEEEIPTDLYPEDLLAKAEGVGGPPPSKPEGEAARDDRAQGGGETKHRTTRDAEPRGQDSPAAKVAAEPTPPDDELEGAGFHINLPWLNESLKALKWSDDTCKSYLVGKYKVSTQGSLQDVLKRLNREQAEEFVADLRNKLEKQPKLIF